MPNTYTQIYIQLVFAVRERACLIAPEWKADIFKYIAGILANRGQKLIAIGGVADHIHILFGMLPSIALSDLVGDVKTSSGNFINEKRFVKGKFYWQEGFGAFSYSRAQIDAVAKYVMDQEKHHANRSFREEYVELLDRFDIEYQDKYLFNWI